MEYSPCRGLGTLGSLQLIVVISNKSNLDATVLGERIRGGSTRGMGVAGVILMNF